MYAIVNDSGRQYKVTEGQSIVVDERAAEVGDTVKFDQVLLFSAGDNDVRIGTPNVPGVTVTATVTRHVKGDKIVVFKKKKRKGMRNTKGHRQKYLEIKITEIKSK